MVGIENLKKAAKFGIEFGEQIAVSAKDGFQTIELFSFIDEIAQLPAIINSKEALIAEFKDLDAKERQELSDYIALEFDIEDDKLEDTIEAALSTIVSILILVDKLKTKKSGI